MAADWMTRGNQIHRISRYCSPQPATAPACVQIDANEDNNFVLKDCRTSCKSVEVDENDATGGTGCNNNNEEVTKLFSTGKVNSCYACHFSERPGEGEGDKNCAKGSGQNRACAAYEDNGCYEAANWHEESGTIVGEFFRGCSSFPETAVSNKCMKTTLGGAGEGAPPPAEYTLCKNWCDKAQCNDDSFEEVDPSDPPHTDPTQGPPSSTDPSSTNPSSTDPSSTQSSTESSNSTEPSSALALSVFAPYMLILMYFIS